VIKKVGFALLKVFEIVLAVLLLFAAIHFRHPFLPGYRVWLFWGVIFLSLGIVIFELLRFKKNAATFLILLITCASLFTAIGLETKHQFIKQSVLNSNPQQLEKLGQHFVVGYRSVEEVKRLVEKRAIAGIFLTTRNIQNKTKSQIKQEIQTLQDIRKSQNLSPLWIATDQEGGIVSRLSPPLTKLPPISQIVAEEKEIERKKNQIIGVAQRKNDSSKSRYLSML
jgi:beta-N-acetylhexosaminidase